tara:strand:- start:25 stop:411 length:387 start_codon:yes stop_codon:yes gene_type:complete
VGPFKVPDRQVVVSQEGMTEQEIEESRLRAQARTQAFLDETARLKRQNSYWKYRAKFAQKNICFLYECECGKLVGAKHALNCPDRDLTPIMPSDFSLTERLQRKEDVTNDSNWDYDADIEKLAEVLTQ